MVAPLCYAIEYSSLPEIINLKNTPPLEIEWWPPYAMQLSIRVCIQVLY